VQCSCAAQMRRSLCCIYMTLHDAPCFLYVISSGGYGEELLMLHEMLGCVFEEGYIPTCIGAFIHAAAGMHHGHGHGHAYIHAQCEEVGNSLPNRLHTYKHIVASHKYIHTY
jgi:hypothetical protein